MSMLFSEQAVRLFKRSLSIMDGFCWGGNRERSFKLASLLREVTPSVARFPCSRWRAVALLMNTIKIRRDLIFIRSSSFAVVQVFLIKLEKPVARAGRAKSRTIWKARGKKDCRRRWNHHLSCHRCGREEALLDHFWLWPPSQRHLVVVVSKCSSLRAQQLAGTQPELG